MGSLGWAGDPARVYGLGKDGGRHAVPACRYWTTAAAAASCPRVARVCPIVLRRLRPAAKLAQRPGLLTGRPRDGIGCSA
ncbi:hypothetical protein RA8CHR_05632 [Variovorax sp. RA8]|jgi:hypothetical protein|nr:hypothetical protein RA8CHR_05632 [Variovorax sp. RA8]